MSKMIIRQGTITSEASVDSFLVTQFHSLDRRVYLSANPEVKELGKI